LCHSFFLDPPDYSPFSSSRFVLFLIYFVHDSVTMATTTDNTTAMTQQQEVSPLPTDKVRMMIDACGSGNLPVIQQLVAENSLYVCQQDFETGLSPLMAAAKSGNLELSQQLLDQGAPWNAVDRQGQCPGNFATDAEHWAVVNLLVEWGTRSELILGELQRSQRKQGQSILDSNSNSIAEHQPCTKPDYLQHRLRYNQDGTALLDEDDDAVMMEWERPIMKAHAQIMMEAPGKRVLNVGFGMGIIDTILQEYNPNLHIIIEAHPDVYKRMLEQKWDQKPNVKIFHGRWQDVMPELIKSGVELDAVFYDTYGEHAFDMEDFHVQMSQILSKPQGVYSFFNGLAPDNLFFHGVGTFLEAKAKGGCECEFSKSIAFLTIQCLFFVSLLYVT
jgi:protein arginine N-methyltransferase 2